MKLFEKFFSLIRNNKLVFIAASITSLSVVIALIFITVLSNKNDNSVSILPETSVRSDFFENEESNIYSESNFSLYDISSAVCEVSSVESVSVPKKVTAPKTAKKTAVKTPAVNKKSETKGFIYNSNVDPDNNVFMDSLIYTGYNMKKHRSDGNMWVYILASRKRGLGYLSNITYNGGCTGYETKNGKPDIKAFEKGGLVCASYASYVYFNYLPNVAGIDTSSLPRPALSTSAHEWYLAAKKWVDLGYSKYIPFKASLSSSGFINFKPESDFPIGSIIIFCDAKHRSDHGSHVCIYAGYVNGYHWVYHVGNANGPEMCAVERMHFGPDPQWPLKVITTPSNIRFSAVASIKVSDKSGLPVSGAVVKLSNKSGKAVCSGKTDASGSFRKDGLTYGDYILSVTAPEGYTGSINKTVALTTKNNSLNEFKFILEKIPVYSPEESVYSQSSNPDNSKASNFVSNISETSQTVE